MFIWLFIVLVELLHAVRTGNIVRQRPGLLLCALLEADLKQYPVPPAERDTKYKIGVNTTVYEVGKPVQGKIHCQNTNCEKLLEYFDKRMFHLSFLICHGYLIDLIFHRLQQ